MKNGHLLFLGILFGVGFLMIMTLGVIHIVQSIVQYSIPIAERISVMYFSLLVEICCMGGTLRYISRICLRKYSSLNSNTV
jgi:hypothetical protein